MTRIYVFEGKRFDFQSRTVKEKMRKYFWEELDAHEYDAFVEGLWDTTQIIPLDIDIPD